MNPIETLLDLDDQPKRWIKLEKHSDWGTIYYAEKGKGLTKNGFADIGLGITFPKKVTVRFPNGETRGEYDIIEKHYREHGHDCSVNSKLYGIEIDYCGLKVWIDLADLSVYL